MKEQPQCEVYPDGTKYWFLNDQLHREDGPAVEHLDGTKKWFLNGKRHREDGPAVEWPGGAKWWWFNDEKVHPEVLVDLHLSRGTFCYYNEQANTLHFAENE